MGILCPTGFLGIYVSVSLCRCLIIGEIKSFANIKHYVSEQIIYWLIFMLSDEIEAFQMSLEAMLDRK